METLPASHGNLHAVERSACRAVPRRRRVLVALVFALTRYGSILIDVTLRPACLSSTPMDDDVIPLPSPLTTPPVTATYFIWRGGGGTELLAVSRRRNERT